MEDSEPLWKRVFLNELVLAAVAAVIILYIAFHLATGRHSAEDTGKPVRISRP